MDSIGVCSRCGGLLGYWKDTGDQRTSQIVHIDEKGNYTYKPHKVELTKLPSL